MAKKVIEVDEEDLLRDQTLRSTLSKIMSNPKGKLLVQQAHKLVDPNAVTPELDNAKIQAEPVLELQKKFDDFVEATKVEKAEQEKNAKLAKLNSDYEAGRSALKSQKWTDDGIKKLEEFMEQKGILDHEIAALAFERLHPPQIPVTPGGSGAWNFMEVPTDDSGDYVKKLIESKGENAPLIDKAVNEAINEVRGQPRR